MRISERPVINYAENMLNDFYKDYDTLYAGMKFKDARKLHESVCKFINNEKWKLSDKEFFP